MALLKPTPGQMEAWAGIDFEREAKLATKYDTQLVNDGNAACWAEFVAHDSPRPGNFAYLLIDTFVAAGIIAEDRLWEGVTGASANLGSMLVSDRQGNRRFVHEIASLFALDLRLTDAGLTIADAVGETPSVEARRVIDIWIADAALALAQCVLNAATVLEFDFAAIESDLPPAILSRLIDAMAREILDVPSLERTRPAVRPGHLGRSGAAQGAAQLRMYRRYYSRELSHMEDE